MTTKSPRAGAGSPFAQVLNRRLDLALKFLTLLLLLRQLVEPWLP